MAIVEIKTVSLAEQSKLNKKQDKKGMVRRNPKQNQRNAKKKGSGGRKAKEAAKMKALNRYDKKTWKEPFRRPRNASEKRGGREEKARHPVDTKWTGTVRQTDENPQIKRGEPIKIDTAKEPIVVLLLLGGIQDNFSSAYVSTPTSFFGFRLMIPDARA